MTLEVARRRGRPILLAARVPRSLPGLPRRRVRRRALGGENLIDIFTLGSRSIEVDVEGYRRITEGRHIKLQPCLDDHHAPDGYRCPPIEVLRGMFANWWQQGADSVMTFNWANAEPKWCEEMGGEVAPRVAIGGLPRGRASPRRSRGKNKTFVVERRGGYPWAEGYFNRNDDSPLPMTLCRRSDDARDPDRRPDPRRGRQACAASCSAWYYSGRRTRTGSRSVSTARCSRRPRAIPAGRTRRSSPPSPSRPPAARFPDTESTRTQKLLRLEYRIDPQCCLVGKNQVEIRRVPAAGTPSGKIDLEKLEVSVRYG